MYIEYIYMSICTVYIIYSCSVNHVLTILA